jgi:adenylate cyclase
MQISKPSIRVTVFDQGAFAYTAAVHGSAEFGRQNQGEAGPFTHRQEAAAVRFVLAKLDETAIPRKAFTLEPADGGRWRIVNNGRVWVKVEPGPMLEPNTTCEVALPVSITVHNKTVRVQPGLAGSEPLQSLIDSTLAPSRRGESARALASLAINRLDEGQLDNEALCKWIQASMSVLQSAAGTADFYSQAARAVVDLVGLDSGRVLLRKGDDWSVQALETARAAAGAAEWTLSRQVAGRVLDEKRTFWQSPDALAAGASLLGVSAVVAAPILDRDGEVIGLLYGERRTPRGTGRMIGRMEAMLVEMLAWGVATGLARQEQEQVAARAQVQMEQFFTPDLARHLFENPGALRGSDREVTVLSCDIRGFSRMCDRLGPTRTLDWLNDVLGALSVCVLDEQGVLVDYVGDELMALWGAPVEQADHAARACRAALRMIEQVAVLNDRWRGVTGEPMDLGIGVSSGVARVGNVGSPVKFKYGALGSTTNLASRVQGANKYLRTRLLVTEATRRRLDAGFAARRLCQVRVINIDAPVALFELNRPGQTAWEDLREKYERALGHFDAGEFRETARILGGLLADPLYRDDGPSLVLMQRAVTALVGTDPAFSPVWTLPGK